MASKPSHIERVYVILSGDDRYDRACSAIPDSECSALPRNYVMNVLNGTAAKTGRDPAAATGHFRLYSKFSDSQMVLGGIGPGSGGYHHR